MGNTVEVIFQIDKDAQGRTTLKQIDKGVDDIGKTSKQAGSQVDGLLQAFKVAIVLDFFKQGVQAAFEFGKAAVAAYSESRAAALGLASVAAFKGIDKGAAQDAVNSLEVVKSGLVSVSDANASLKNLLASGLSLDQATQLLRVFGDTAAFGKPQHLSLGEALRSGTEGIKNQNSVLTDNLGISKNISKILEERGFQLQDTTDKLKGQAAQQALVNGFTKEGAAQAGDAAKLANEFAGGQAKLAAAQEKILVQIGEMITKNPALNDAFKEVGKSLEIITKNLQDTDSELSKFVRGSTTLFAAFVLGLAEVAGKLETILFLSQSLTSGGLIEKITGLNLFPKADPATQKILDDAKKFNEAFNEARKVKPGVAQDAAAPFKVSDKELEALRTFMKESEEKAKKFQESVKEITVATNELQTKLSTNPIGQMYDAALRKQQEFLSKFKEVPAQVSAAFKKASDEVIRLDLFKGTLGQGLGLNNLLFEKAKLEAGLGGKKELTAQDEKKVTRIQSGLIDSQISTATNLLAKAENAQQKALANQSILGATNDIRNLTPGQVEARLKALNDQIVIETAAFKENFDRLKAQTTATTDNTVALQAVGNRLAQVDQALANFKEGVIIKVVDDTLTGVGIDLGGVE